MTFIAAAVLKETQSTETGLKLTSLNGDTQILAIDPDGLFAGNAPQFEPGMRIISVNHTMCDGKPLLEVEQLINDAEGIVAVVVDDGAEASLVNTSVSPNDNERGILKINMLSTLGWTPNLWKHFHEGNFLSAAMFFFLFILDLADAVFDLILSIRTMMHGSAEGAGIRLGILLFIMTIIGRIVSGIYGWTVANYYIDDDDAFLRFAFMEMTVFFLEDGASILVLANSTGGMDAVQTTSMCLTSICAICYTGYFLSIGCKNMFRIGMDVIGFLLMLSAAGSVAFQSYILIAEVIISKDYNTPLSGTLEMAAFAVYGVSAVCLGGYAVYEILL